MKWFKKERHSILVRKEDLEAILKLLSVSGVQYNFKVKSIDAGTYKGNWVIDVRMNHWKWVDFVAELVKKDLINGVYIYS